MRHTHTHPFNGPFSRTTRVSQYQKGKTNLDFTEARDSEWQRHQPTSQFFTGRMHFMPPNQQRQSTEGIHTVCGSVYVMTQCPSICLSVWPILCHSGGMRRVCCCGPSRHAVSIDCCTVRLQQVRTSFGPDLQQHGGQQQMRLRAASILERCRELTIDCLLSKYKLKND